MITAVDGIRRRFLRNPVSQNARALVTGAGSGIGRAFALGLVAAALDAGRIVARGQRHAFGVVAQRGAQIERRRLAGDKLTAVQIHQARFDAFAV